MDGAALVRRYYDALDDHEYETLAGLLDPTFVQQRPDRTFESREAFVAFMREKRPNPDTSHDLAELVVDDERGRIAARGRVLEGEAELFEFADFFELADDSICRLETYSR
ncbi:nuclear transport factor 2 family protein [Halostagnicola kamekurae]|nr:nuclear transport factor 2 family protein [Halostagnicola kamekurae]